MKLERVFLDVATQQDRMIPGGAYYVPGAETIVPLLQKLKEFAVKNDALIISPVDVHNLADSEFCDHPSHCVKGTPGQEKIPETLAENRTIVGLVAESDFNPAPYQQIIIYKTDFDPFSNPNLEGILSKLHVEELCIYGIATEEDIRAAAIGAAERGYHVTAFKDAIKAVREDEGEKAIFEMMALDIEMISARELLEME